LAYIDFHIDHSFEDFLVYFVGVCTQFLKGKAKRPKKCVDPVTDFDPDPQHTLRLAKLEGNK
jgi:hypothetical protein